MACFKLNYPKETLRRAQGRLMKNATLIRDLFDAENISYSIGFGSLLGAVRHGGFVPWDDDFDFFIDRRNYDHAISILERELPPTLMVHSIKTDPLYFHCWARVKDTTVEVVPTKKFHPDNEKLKFQYLSIDLHPLDRILFKNARTYLHNHAKAFYDRKLNSGLITPKEYREGTCNIDSYVESKAKNFSTSLQDDTEVLFYPVALPTPLLTNDFYPLKSIQFGKESFMRPNKPRKILTTMYGDLMSIPNFSERQLSYQSVYFKKN